MSDLKAQFEAAAAAIQNLPKRPDNNTLLQIYALYKQATTGDATGKRPGMFDMVGQAKYDAWAKLKGTTREQAMNQYIALAERLK
ncbi:MAG TPA: acyl-CoA-binding protein [Kouleothrix sp.]|jgi:acyl-CoA-binding protein|nr:acyl-CoA-binding protein [Kouleothrix sp.]